MTPAQESLLAKRLIELPINKDLVELLQFHGYDTLGKVLDKDISFHRDKNGLTIHDELELFRFVNANGLKDFWKNG